MANQRERQSSHLDGDCASHAARRGNGELEATGARPAALAAATLSGSEHGVCGGALGAGPRIRGRPARPGAALQAAQECTAPALGRNRRFRPFFHTLVTFSTSKSGAFCASERAGRKAIRPWKETGGQGRRPHTRPGCCRPFPSRATRRDGRDLDRGAAHTSRAPPLPRRSRG